MAVPERHPHDSGGDDGRCMHGEKEKSKCSTASGLFTGCKGIEPYSNHWIPLFNNSLPVQIPRSVAQRALHGVQEKG